jgi:hypothetical protein
MLIKYNLLIILNNLIIIKSIINIENNKLFGNYFNFKILGLFMGGFFSWGAKRRGTESKKNG